MARTLLYRSGKDSLKKPCAESGRRWGSYLTPFFFQFRLLFWLAAGQVPVQGDMLIRMAALILGTSAGAVVIPQAAVRASEKGFLAYIVADGKAVERVVEIGQHTADGMLEVKRGLTVGEQLVVRGAEALRQGAPIGLVGSTGNADPRAPHLHFEIWATAPDKKWWDDGVALNPFPLLKSGAAP